MSESKMGGPGVSKIDEFKLMESALDHTGPIMGFYYNTRELLISRGASIDHTAEAFNDDSTADRVAGIFGRELHLDNLRRNNRKELLTYQETENKMVHDESPFLAMQPREAGVFFYQIVTLLSQYGIKAEDILEIIEHKFDKLSEEIADAVKPKEDEEKPDGLAVGEHK
jgi:hypothetical protein